jgi:CheY-like chemotaxis protein
VADTIEDCRQPASVLVVDDDPDIRAMYGRRLGADGFDVSFAADGWQALVAASGPPAIILLDLRMPGMNGLEVLGRLKENPTTATVPVVILSNESDPDTMATCVRTGAVAWWSKSEVAPAELSRRVRELLSAAAVP